MMNLRLWKLKFRRIHLKQAILYLLIVIGFVAFVFTSSSTFYLDGGGGGGAVGAGSSSGSGSAFAAGSSSLTNNADLKAKQAAHPARREPASADYVVNSNANAGNDAAVVVVDMGTVEVVKGEATDGKGGSAVQMTSEKGQTVRTLRQFGKGFTSRGLAPSAGGSEAPSALSSWWSIVMPSGGRPWFFTNGSFCPDPSLVNSQDVGRMLPLWPDEDPGDRIIEQLMYVPPKIQANSSSLLTEDPNDSNAIISDNEENVVVQERQGHLHVVHKAASSSSSSSSSQKDKMILLYQHGWPHAKLGKESFAECPVKNCAFTKSKHDMRQADAVLFKDFVPAVPRPSPDQAWILYLLESPMHTQGFFNVRSINWTATYRRDSDIVAPYAKWVYYDPKVTSITPPKNFAANKTKMVAWFVSNCHARNNRLQYARELAKHVGVDIYGACGNYKCPKNNANMCFDLLNARYKFYLAFENSNCVDYITEKLFLNGLGNDVVPIVMGARPEDYARMAPKKSYIHVDDFPSPAALAEYLKKLNADDNLYNDYFSWRGTGEFINTFFFCRLCAMLNDPVRPAKEYVNLSKWWRLDAMCRRGSWNNNTNGKPSGAELEAARAAYAAKKRQQLLAGNSVYDDYAAAKNGHYDGERKRRSLGADDLVRSPKGYKWPVLL